MFVVGGMSQNDGHFADVHVFDFGGLLILMDSIVQSFLFLVFCLLNNSIV